MTTIAVYKAQPIGTHVPDSLTIVADIPIPDPRYEDDWETHARDVYTQEGICVAEALCAHLPGGTVDAVLRHLLLKRASLLVVPF